jgi:hypothetical protein
MKINLRVEYVSGEAIEASATAPDLVAFEDKFSLSVTKLESEMKFTHLVWLAWTSLHRSKKVSQDFEAWLETVASVGPSETPK